MPKSRNSIETARSNIEDVDYALDVGIGQEPDIGAIRYSHVSPSQHGIAEHPATAE